MENLKKAVKKILATVETVAKAYVDKKIVWTEWLQIGGSAVGWTWVFKHIPEIKADLDTATEDGVKTMMEEIKAEFDIPQDQIEETLEQVLSVILLFIVMLEKKTEIPDVG